MECNKEEAIRAKDIAVKKMQNKDFTGALKIAAKAKQLFQDLENVSQMITVCEVHCAAEKRLFGNEMDWYAILKVEPTADEATIKKQYRKFALQLHPEKNNFRGAEAAFKLIGDALRILLDKGKRSAHDMKRGVTVNRPAPAAAYRPPQKPSKSAPPASPPKAFDVPESEFYDFDADKSQEKFLVGQIWALYGDEDGLPRYYGEIEKIESNPVFKIHLRWLVACRSQSSCKWLDRDMPTGCGTLRIKKGASQAYSSVDSFSHKLNAEVTDRKDEYAILPRKGEIWALYRNWTPEIKCSDLGNWEYDIVQVLEETDGHIVVLVLERVDGFNSIFKAKVEGQSNVTVEIPRESQLRFSHQIPFFQFFQLTDERNGSLRGCWELDPAALPVHYCSS